MKATATRKLNSIKLKGLKGWIGTIILLIYSSNTLRAQLLTASDSAFQAHAPFTGHLWGYTFGDYFYTLQADSSPHNNPNQYASNTKGDNAFAIRRVYLGYDYNISKKIRTHLLLDAENWSESEKLSPFIKYAYFSWDDVWKGATLMVGQTYTLGFSKTSEAYWGYRSIEKTITDRRGTPSYDLGIALKGFLDKRENYGYHLMIGNGTGAVADNDNFRKFYGSVFGLFFDKKLMVNLYADYERLDWQPKFHHAAGLFKLFTGYKAKAFTAGIEGFLRHAQNDVIISTLTKTDTANAYAIGLSLFIRGILIPSKLGYFARTDFFNPLPDYDKSLSYKGLSKNYDPNFKEQFVTFGLDYTPVKNIHLMPNIWYNASLNQKETGLNSAVSATDLVARITFYFIFKE